MPRRMLATMRTDADMIDEVERARGVASSDDVMTLCALYRAAERTMRAQREVIAAHVRTIDELRKKST